MDVIDELIAAVAAARESRAAADRDHEHVKDLLLRARIERGDEYGPADLEAITGRYLDRATISRLTSPATPGQRKATRRRTGT